ncbi:hypothetical protein CBR_g34664 [Chara braunii]|uniref:Uncharacterized protein n=1 Tax=Chara braunii TaxID=69332 RepID=A0A388JYS5_CHABU|nr:hypothetical protein CBR_g34664 [Chara braunii]|eukprot:GBG62964.1 hypothetical protein CBR_g34664 [Chara braunii]
MQGELWGLGDVEQLNTILDCVRAHSLPTPFKEELLAFKSYIGALLAMRSGYATVVGPLLTHCRHLIRRHSLAFPIPLDMIEMQELTYAICSATCPSPAVAVDRLQTLGSSAAASPDIADAAQRFLLAMDMQSRSILQMSVPPPKDLSLSPVADHNTQVGAGANLKVADGTKMQHMQDFAEPGSQLSTHPSSVQRTYLRITDLGSPKDAQNFQHSSTVSSIGGVSAGSDLRVNKPRPFQAFEDKFLRRFLRDVDGNEVAEDWLDPREIERNLVVPVGTSFPSGASRDHPCLSCISQTPIKGPAMCLEDGLSLATLSEAIMWSRVNPFSPTGSGHWLVIR